jgi:hypothetical protein
VRAGHVRLALVRLVFKLRSLRFLPLYLWLRAPRLLHARQWRRSPKQPRLRSRNLQHLELVQWFPAKRLRCLCAQCRQKQRFVDAEPDTGLVGCSHD